MVKKEYIFVMVLTFVENFLLIAPAIYTYTKIISRHKFLEDTIGAVPKEIMAMKNIESIAIAAPMLVILSLPVQLGLMWAFNRYGHPWKAFLQ